MPAKILKKMMLLVFIFVCPLLVPSFSFTTDEDLKLLNKPSMKTIIDDGDIYDCVDINKQPAFDHPSLKNHKIQLRPSSYPVGLFDDDDDDNISNSSTSIEIGLPDGGCPSGTVPIRRLTKENLMRMKSSLKNMKIMNPPSMHNDTNEELQRQLAVYFTLQNKLPESYGASAFIDAYSLRLTQERQFSSSKIWLMNNEDPGQVNLVGAGWMISIESYGDAKTRLSAAWTNDNFEKTGCIDTSCPGFVQVSRELPLGMALAPLSTFGGPQFGLNVLIFKDPHTQRWWLFLRKNQIPIGYWPNDIFTHLSSNANRLTFGGVVGYLDNADRPPMGSGHFPFEGAYKAGYFSNVKYVDKENQIRHINAEYLEPFSSLENCYYVGPYIETGGVIGNMFYFGGPGYC